MKSVRCAIYTRKSSDEGLDQSFNSLDAQREACAAYILDLSQAGEGWTALPDRYDDGGVSGGTLERPALRRLMADVEARKVDIVVVYKVDRLSRSLFDFAKLVEAFDRVEVSFVSITQAMNTTTSMGRLTLNMLLSFAQFEREVTAERIRDKIAASKAKGMWMGGVPPIGYEPDGRSLRIVEEHASLVRTIFERYLVLGNVRLLAEELARERIHAPARTLTTGKSIGSRPLSRGQLYKMLSCPTYVGEVVHQKQTYTALHAPIIDRDTWDRVQLRLKENTQGSGRTREPQQSLLAGRLVDEAGEPLVPVHSIKGKVRYSYYVSKALQQGGSDTGVRMPARELDIAVCGALADALKDPLELMATASLNVPASGIASFAERVKDLEAGVRTRRHDHVRPLISQVRLRPHGLEIICNVGRLSEQVEVACEESAPETFTISVGMRLSRSGRAMRLVQGEGTGIEVRHDAPLIRVLTQAHRYWRELRTGAIDITRFAEQEGLSPAYVTRVLRLAFLSPTVVAAMLDGKQRATVTAKDLIATNAVDPDWKAQAAAFLPA